MRVLVTGASGFVGHALVQHLESEARYDVRAASRSAISIASSPVEYCASPALGPEADWSAALRDVQVVVHAAARVHVMNDTADDPLHEFRHANVEGTLALAKQAAACGVRRFVFVSSIKVNGEHTLPGKPYRACDVPAPCDAYGVSKAEAERGLQELAAQSDMELVIVRPVLVYGPGVKANFLSMMAWLKRGIPLPLGGIENRRSLVALANLVDLIRVCLDHPGAAGQIFLVSDGEDLSTSALLRKVGQALGRPARLLPVPASWLSAGAAILKRKSVAQRLCGSLQVDIEPTCKRLQWSPPVSVDEALRQTSQHFLKEHG